MIIMSLDGANLVFFAEITTFSQKNLTTESESFWYLTDTLPVEQGRRRSVVEDGDFVHVKIFFLLINFPHVVVWCASYISMIKVITPSTRGGVE